MTSGRCAWGAVVMLLAITSAPEYGFATAVTASFGVSVTVDGACTASVSSARLGNHIRRIVNATSAVSVSCTHSTPYNVGLSEGSELSATVVNRTMVGPGASPLRAFVAKPGTGELANWVNAIGMNIVSETGSGSSQVSSVLGEILWGQDVQDGTNTDTITVWVSY